MTSTDYFRARFGHACFHYFECCRFNAVVRRNEPSRHTHPRHEPAYKPITANSHDGYSPPVHTDQGGRDLSSNSRNEYSGYPPSKAVNSGFNVDHTLKNTRESSLTPY